MVCARLLGRRSGAAVVAVTISLFGQALAAQAADDGFLYTGALYDDRYSDSIFTLDAMKPFGSPRWHIRPYADILLNLDSQSLSLEIPETLTDNYALGAVGVQYETGAGLRAFAQVGLTARIGAVSAREPGGDIRGGLQLFRGWGGRANHRSAFGNYFGSATYVSRDRDMVLYNQIQAGRTFESMRRPIDLYLRGTVSLDTHSFYYANYAEGALGMRIRPGLSSPISLSVEKIAGFYLRSLPRPLTTSEGYRDLRMMLNFGVPL